MARLHVLVGAGGVGKTTLAAGLALALARAGRRTGLLGIDPSRRLQDALGAPLADAETDVAGAPGLRAAILQPHQALARWVGEACADRDAAARLEANAFFGALGDRLATATDVLAAVRLAEWAEHDPALDDLVVDTAPGTAALDFLRDPREVLAVVEGPVVRWLRAAARSGGGRAARRVVGTFGRLAGSGLVAALADFFALAGPPLERMAARLARAQAWLHGRDTELLLVTSPRDTGATGARRLADALAAEQLVPRAVIVNRTWPPELATELAGVAVPGGAERFVAYARAQLAAQAAVIDTAAALAPRVVTVPSLAALERSGRDALVELGEVLRARLSPARQPPPDPRAGR